MLSHRNNKPRYVITTLLLGMIMSVLTIPIDTIAEEMCEVPLFVMQNSGGANLMILADNSFSMNMVINHEGYDKDSVWPGEFDNDATYFVAKSGGFEPNDFNINYAASPTLYLVNSDNGEDGRYSGNYLNWLYYHATENQRNTAPTVTRIQVLKLVLNNIVDRSDQLRIGITVFQKSNDGGNIIGPIGKSHVALQAIISGITANAQTPTGESLESILDYFGHKTQSPIENECQFNFILLVTDGLPTMDVDVSSYLHDADGDGNDPGDCASIGAPYDNAMECSDHMDDVAYWMAHEDVAPHFDEVQNIFTYVIGFHEDADILRETADNGLGLYFEAKNAVELFASIEYALQDILRRISAGAAVAVVSSESNTDDRMYRGKFMPVDWEGYLECYALPCEEGDPCLWEAGSLLRARNLDTRIIFTALGEDMYMFKTGNAGFLRDKMNAADDIEAADLIDWGRGNPVDGYRDRQERVLGDIIHSTPVVVGAPSQYVPEESYEVFREANEFRRKMIYVSANDGMVHGFDAETGNEHWAFVPEFALPKFAVMADSFYCHTYSCDQTVAVKDIKLNGVWRTVMVAGGGEGGSSLFAMDITDPDSPEVLWQADLPNGKKNHSEVEMVSIAGMPVVLVGSGMDADNMEAYLYAYHGATGNLMGTTLLSSDPIALRNKASRPAVVDLNLDGQADIVYMADMLGKVYRIKLNGSYEPSGWQVTTLYEGDREIQADPVAALGPNGAIYVYFGTGVYIDVPDMTSLNVNSFLCVFDHHDGTTATMADMVDQTSSIVDVGSSSGWYINLWNADGERATTQAVVVAETVIFTSFAPSDDICVAGGVSYMYQMSYDDGGIPDVDYMSDEEDRSVEIGEGIASYPVVDLSGGNVVVQSSDASINVEPIAGIIQRLVVHSWQENYSHIQ